MDDSRETQADSGLNPPPRVPPLALATSEPPPNERRMVPTPAGPYDLIVLLRRALDQLDSIADRIAQATGLR